MADVICVGGSVAGAAVAGFLARSGRRVVVLDRAEFPRSKACGEGLLPHGCDVLDRLGVELPEASTVRGIRFEVRDRLSSQYGRSVWLPFPGRSGRASSRYVLDAAIRSRAAVLGAEFVQANVTRIEPGRVITDHGVFEAPFLIGADGTHSMVGKYAGSKTSSRRRARLGMSSHWEGARTAPDEVNVIAFRGGELYMAPVENGLTLAALLLNHRFFYDHPQLRHLMDDFLREHVPTRFGNARQVGKALAAFPLTSRVTPMAGSNWLLVGDAAGAIDPISGEGLSVALRGAEIAADCLVNGWNAELYAERMRAMRRPIERLTGIMLFLARHRGLASVAFRFEKSLAPMMRVAVGES